MNFSGIVWFFGFLSLAPKTCFPNISYLTLFGIVILADSESHSLGASFWYLSHVTCENMHVSGSNCIFNVESIWSSHGVPTQMMTNLSLHRLHIDSMWSTWSPRGVYKYRWGSVKCCLCSIITH
jgi:hypothetical protein